MSLSLFAFVGCGPDDDDVLDETKSHLYVVTYNGGWGYSWLEQMASEFEQMYANYSFEEGKQGVVIHIKEGKSDVTGDNVKTLMKTSNYDVYFTTFNLRQYYLDGLLMDVTDLVANTTDAKYAKVWSDLGETKTIAEKMDPTIKDLIEYAGANAQGVVDSENPKYYGIPMYSSFYNLNYDIDLFYEKGFYMDNNGRFIAGTNGDKSKEAAVDAQKSVGQDGVAGTEDDGLPITFADFTALCNYMKQCNVAPMCWGGSMSGYRAGYLNNVWANYEGANDWYINVTGTGTDSEGVTYTLEAKNGYLTAGQEGRKAALTFAEKVVRNTWYSVDASTSTDHTGSQDKFLMSKLYASQDDSYQQIAMILEGGWWEHEARETIDTMATMYGGEYVNRRFGVMTYPRMDSGSYTKEDGTNDMVLVSVTPDSNVAIRKNAKLAEAAQLFFIYTTTDKCLRTYTRISGSTRCYDYDLTDEDKAQMSTYKVSLWNYYKRALDSQNVRYITGPGKFGEYNPQIVSSSYGVTYTAIPDKDSNKIYSESDGFLLFMQQTNLTATQYFESYKKYYTQNNGQQWISSFCKNL